MLLTNLCLYYFAYFGFMAASSVQGGGLSLLKKIAGKSSDHLFCGAEGLLHAVVYHLRA